MFSRLLATFSFFTRLPFWRLAELKKEDYQRVVPFWPLAGWITGGTMALTFWGASFVLPLPVAVVLAVVARMDSQIFSTVSEGDATGRRYCES